MAIHPTYRLIKTMQQQAFVEEREYLSNSTNDNIPGLVKKKKNWIFVIIRELSVQVEDKCYMYDYEMTHSPCQKNTLWLDLILSHLNATIWVLPPLWIPHARQAIKIVILECILCKIFKSISFAYPEMACLPKTRVNLVKSFLHMGIDSTSHIQWMQLEGEVKCTY